MVDLIELRNGILREMYAEAEPPLDFDKVLSNPSEYPEDWYQRHYLSSEECKRIYEKHTSDVSLTRSESFQLTMECLMNLAPASPPSEY